MSPKRKVTPILPYANGRRVPLYNPRATYTIAQVFKFLATHQLYAKLCATESGKSKRKRRALVAVRMREEGGYQNGLNPHDLAAELGCTYRSARSVLNQAGDMMWKDRVLPGRPRPVAHPEPRGSGPPVPENHEGQ